MCQVTALILENTTILHREKCLEVFQDQTSWPCSKFMASIRSLWGVSYQVSLSEMPWNSLRDGPVASLCMGAGRLHRAWCDFSCSHACPSAVGHPCVDMDEEISSQAENNKCFKVKNYKKHESKKQLYVRYCFFNINGINDKILTHKSIVI